MRAVDCTLVVDDSGLVFAVIGAAMFGKCTIFRSLAWGEMLAVDLIYVSLLSLDDRPRRRAIVRTTRSSWSRRVEDYPRLTLERDARELGKLPLAAALSHLLGVCRADRASVESRRFRPPCETFPSSGN